MNGGCCALISLFIILQNRMTNLTQLYKDKFNQFCKNILVYSRGIMKRNDEAFYMNIVEIIDSQEQPKEVKQSEVKRADHRVASQVKKKAADFITNKKDKQSSNHSCIQMQKKPSSSIKFQDISNFNDIQVTLHITKHMDTLRQFIQKPQKNVLFVFGPSGCGKTLMTLTALTKNSLNYELVQEKVEQNQYGENIYEDNIDMLYRIFSFQDRIRQKIYILKDYPIAVSQMPSSYASKFKIFKENAYDLIQNISNRNKYIFLLNSQIYSSYYLMSEASQNKAIRQLKNVSIIKMEPYGITDLKKIITRFTNSKPDYSTVTNQAKAIEQIITEANGDARKALNIIYYKKIRQIGRLNPNKNSFPNGRIKFYDQTGKPSKSQGLSKSKKKFQLGSFGSFSEPKQQQQKQQLKVGIFHALGKLLYGKRKNKFYNPAEKRNKKNNDISCYYTQKEIDDWDPGFYFKPVQLIEKAHLNLNVCVDLLEENFLDRYGKVRDIMKMYNIFRYYDSYLEDSLNKFEVKEQLMQNLKELITWGIIVYNRNTVRQGGMACFTRSKNNIYQKIISKKEELFEIYYIRQKYTETTIKYNRKDIIQLGHLLYNSYSNLPKKYLYQQKLVEIIFDNGRNSNSIVKSDISRQVSVIQDQQQEIGNQNCNTLNKLAEIMLSYQKKKQDIFKMIAEDSDGSDIDSD